MKKALSLTLWTTLWALVACFAAPAAAPQPPAGKAKEKPRPTQPAPGLSKGTVAPQGDPPYVISPLDVVEVTVWKEPDLTRVVTVRPDGKITLPLLGDIQAAGLTPAQLSSSVAQDLQKYLQEPKVTANVTTMNTGRVYILGEVNKPGPLTLTPNMRALQAISSAGGLNSFADQKHIHILRTENGKQVRYPFNYKQVIAGKQADQNIVLKPEDTIIVP